MKRHSGKHVYAQPRTIGWGILPRFIFAGLLSSAYALIALQKSELHEGTNGIITVLVGGFCLGLLLVAALWFYKGLDSWRSAWLLVAIMTATNSLGLLANNVPAPLRGDNAIPFLGVTENYQFILFFPTCLVALIGFTTVLLHWRNTLRSVPIAFTFSVLAALAFNHTVEKQRGGWISPFPGDVLGLVWQLTLVSFLAFSLWMAQISIHLGSSEVQDPMGRSLPSVRNGLVSLSILIACFIGVQMWTTVLIRAERKKDAVHRAQVRAALANAPSRENLPTLEQEAAEQLLLSDIPGCIRYLPKVEMVSAEDALPAIEQSIPRALFPERYLYTATYTDESQQNSIRVDITAYPTDEWAGYYVKPMPVLYPGIWKTVKFGNGIYHAGTAFVWSSANKVIRLDCRLAQPPMIEELLRAYLARYPSSLGQN